MHMRNLFGNLHTHKHTQSLSLSHTHTPHQGRGVYDSSWLPEKSEGVFLLLCVLIQLCVLMLLFFGLPEESGQQQ